MRAHAVTELRFHGASERTGPLNWAQKAIWSVICWEGQDAYRRNLHSVWELPDGTAESAVLDAFGDLLAGYEALRTSYENTEAGVERVLQRVHGAGAVPVHRYEVSGPPDTWDIDGIVADILPQPFAFAALPVRIALVSVAGKPVRAVCVVAHVAVDGWSLRVIHDAFPDVLARGRDSDAYRSAVASEQPIDRAEYEGSAQGARMAERTLAHWRDAFRDVPRSMFAGDSELRPVPETSLIHSHRMARAVARICDDLQVTASNVILAAGAQVMACVLDEEEVALRSLIALRFKPKARYSVGAVNLNGLFRVRITAGEGFRDFLSRVASSAVTTALYSQCDPVLQEAELERIMRERGSLTKKYAFFNDKRYVSRPRESAVTCLDTDPRCAGGGTWFRDYTDVKPDMDSKYLLMVHDVAAAVELSLYLDRLHFPLGPVPLLTAMERLLEAAADDPGVPADAVARAALAEPVSGPAGG
ncbi:condensation domain-containing protein [Streptomyces sp. CA-111067]|uniref:condensation domain-containing protein n=1 Tax=Streptomyces sp. CA-111067 TaxID=3240046 RepID=UPI003D95F7A4